MKKISLFAITLLVAAGCSEEEYEGTMSGTHGSFLPGEYPVVLAAGGLEIIVSPKTRSTFDGNWDGAGIVAATDDGAAAYRISDGRLVPDDPYNPLRWSSKTSPVSVTGWYAYGMTEEYAATRPETFTVQQDQSTAEGVRKSDFLYAEGLISYNGNKNLSFKHCLTKLRINVTYKDGASGTFTWKYPFIIEGQIGTGGTVTANTDGVSAVVIPAKLSTPYGGYDETFEFMLPVQSLTGGELLATFFPSGGGEADLPVPSAGVQLKPGVAMAIAVVISPLSISINGNIAWGEGGGGSGSVIL